jgi:outer membrane protein, heavy metal efflux system
MSCWSHVSWPIIGPVQRLAVIVCLVALSRVLLIAQSPASPGALTLDAAIERALAANAAIAAARLTRPIHIAGLRVAGERPNPEVNAEIEKETPKQSLGVAVPFELGGKRAKRLAVGEATLRAADAELAAITAQVRNDVRRAYFDVLVAERRLAVLGELRDLSARARDAARTRFESGDVPRLEALQADLAFNTAITEATSAEGAVTAARAKFDVLLGPPSGSGQHLSTPLDAGVPIVTAEMLQLAHTQSTELAALDRRIDEQRARFDLSRALRAPDVVAGATLTHDAEPEFTYGWRAAVSMTVPLFTTHAAGVAVEQATLAQLVAQRQATVAHIDAEVTAAAASAEAERVAYARYRDSILPQAQQVEQLAQDSYQLGQTGLAALLQALQASRDVRLRALDAVSRYQSAVADLERAIGAPLQ